MSTPVGELETFGVGKETTFGTFATPTLFHPMESFSEAAKNTFNPRTGVRGSPSEAAGATGPFDGSLTMRPEATPDTIGQLLAYAMGTQSAPAAYLTSTVAKTSTLTFGKLVQLPSFSIERNHGNGILQRYIGCVIDSLKLSLDSGKNLAVDVTQSYLTEIKASTGTTPTYSTKFPLTMEAAAGSVQFGGVTIGNGSANPPAVLKWDWTLNNQLNKSYRSVGTRFVYGFPLGMRKASGTLTLGFENDAAKLAFWGSSDPGSPNYTVAGVSLQLVVGGQDYADPGALLIPYQLILTMPNVQITADNVNSVMSGPLQQAVTYEVKDSVPGAGDAVSMTLINTATAAY